MVPFGHANWKICAQYTLHPAEYLHFLGQAIGFTQTIINELLQQYLILYQDYHPPSTST